MPGADETILIYLPGVHGDDSLAGGFRDRLGPGFRWVPTRYAPRVVGGLGDLVDEALGQVRAAGVRRGWLVAESFGSQVAWALLERCARDPQAAFHPEGLILVGGFARHPLAGVAGWLGRYGVNAPEWLVRFLLGSYRLYGILRFAHDRARRLGLARFCRRRRRPADRAAVAARLELIGACDPSEIAARTRIPVHALTGMWDLLVPWPPVLGFLRRRCPGLRSRRLLLLSGHAVLVERPATAARIIRAWCTAAAGPVPHSTTTR